MIFFYKRDTVPFVGIRARTRYLKNETKEFEVGETALNLFHKHLLMQYGQADTYTCTKFVILLILTNQSILRYAF